MKIIKLKNRVPKLIDYALAFAISSIPGFAEADAETRAVYQSITKHFIASGIKSKRKFINKQVKSATSAASLRETTAA